MSQLLFQWSARVYFEDTDAGGIVYHARYLAFYERARTEMLRHYGFHQQKLLSGKIAFAVRRMTIDYLVAARLDDLLMIETELVSIKKASLIFTQRIFNQQHILLSCADVLIACINPDQLKPVALPKSIVAEFSQWKV